MVEMHERVLYITRGKVTYSTSECIVSERSGVECEREMCTRIAKFLLRVFIIT